MKKKWGEKCKEPFYFIKNEKQNYTLWKILKMRLSHLKIYMIQTCDPDDDRAAGMAVSSEAAE